MVRTITYTLLAFCLLCCGNSNVKDIERYQLHGNVERVDIVEDPHAATAAQDDVNTSLREAQGDVNTSLQEAQGDVNTSLRGAIATWQSVHFNTDGMLDSIIFYSPQDTLRNIYVYNSKGLLSEIQVKHTDGKYEALYEYEYYDKTISSYAFRGVDMQVLYRWDYDIESGKQVGCRCYNEGVLINTSEYTYDGLDKTEKVYSTEGELLGETTYKYVSPGRISHISSNGFEIGVEYGDDNLPCYSTNAIIGHDGEIFTNSDSHLYGTIYYEYIKDEKGNWIERTEYLGDKKVKGKTIRRNIIYR